MSTKRSKKPVKQTSLNSIDRIDSIRLAIDYGIDLQNRTLLVSGTVNDSMYDQVAYGLSVLNQLQAPSVTIRLNSEGGSVYSAIGIFDLIKLNKTPVDITATGLCMSAGTVIMQAARIRRATKFTQFMLHHGSEAVSGTHKDVQRYVQHSKELEAVFEEIFCTRCDWTDEKYADLHRHDTYLTADEARRLKVIDEVIQWQL